MWEVIAEMERARLQGDDGQARRLEGIVWRLVGVIERDQHGGGVETCDHNMNDSSIAAAHLS